MFNTDHSRLQSLLIHPLTQIIPKYVTDLIMANYKMNQ